ncbi:MAG TPA: methyltransferase [Hyphomicrobiaceae bacterium]|nr:methyltransferase [Hyphomicrobiaceae bacterium]
MALTHPHLAGQGFDLPAVQPHFEAYVRQHGLSDRIGFRAGDFFADPLPSADVLVIGHVLHNWDLDQKRTLIGKAYAALPRGGALIVYETIIDGKRELPIRDSPYVAP